MHASCRLVYVMTVPLSLTFPSGFLRGKVDYLREHGVEIHVVSSPGKDLDAFHLMGRVPVHGVEMSRRITPFHDLIALCRLTAVIRRLRPSIVHANTPKGGLLGTIAALLARVPVRIYHMHGLPYMTASGLKRRILLLTERISCALAHRVFCVSESLREVALAEGICSSDKLVVLGGMATESTQTCVLILLVWAMELDVWLGNRSAYHRIRWSWVLLAESSRTRGSWNWLRLGRVCAQPFPVYIYSSLAPSSPRIQSPSR